ncbi:DUF6153 family protein [Microbacterium aurugineum]|uniref:DUF6153 family protein n=1 Tax=Microbacterium aurugineum TaxID=2851642 RepID=UPI0020BDF40E|nr:DUF6153 family protein [Microbacterium aurugineum]MCK8477836.1 DUF6153 family protein [Microbacterium aurugineum]
MAPAATFSGGSSSSIFRGVLTGVLLVAAIIIGLLGMHTLNLHGTAAADAPAAAAISVDHAATVHHGVMQASSAGSPTDTTQMSCAECGTDDHVGIAMICVLGLLLALVLLLAPSLLRGWLPSLLQSRILPSFRAQALRRAPSLHVLCISRT